MWKVGQFYPKSEQVTLAMSRTRLFDVDEVTRKCCLKIFRDVLDKKVEPTQRFYRLVNLLNTNPINIIMARKVTNDLILERLDVDEDFRSYYMWLTHAPDKVPE